MQTIRWILMAVCVADVVLGLLILFVPRLLLQLFGIPLPDEMLWFQLIGLMLIPGAVDGFVGFRLTGLYNSNIMVSAGSRLATGAFLLTVTSVRNVPWILVVLGVGEALVGCLTVIYLWKISRTPSVVTRTA
jgi:hypothetical protein